MKGHTKRKINYKKTKKNHKRTKLIGGNEYGNHLIGTDKNGNDYTYTRGDILYSTDDSAKKYELIDFIYRYGYIIRYKIKCLTNIGVNCPNIGKELNSPISLLGRRHIKADIVNEYNEFKKGDTIKKKLSVNNNDNSTLNPNEKYKIEGFLNMSEGITHCLLKNKKKSIVIPVEQLNDNTYYKPLNNGNENGNGNGNNNFDNNLGNIDLGLKNILERFDYFCWDFDDTIAHNNIDRHLSLYQEAINISGEDLYNNYFYDAENLIKLMIYLKKNDKKIFIISFGDAEVIATLLNNLFNYYFTNRKKYEYLKPQFNAGDNVFGLYRVNNEKKNLGSIELKRKVNVIEDLMYNNVIQDKSKILFFDDDYNNTEAMNKFDVSAVTIYGKKTIKITKYLESKYLESKYKELRFPDISIYGFKLQILYNINDEIEFLKTPISENYLFESFNSFKKSQRQYLQPQYPPQQYLQQQTQQPQTKRNFGDRVRNRITRIKNSGRRLLNRIRGKRRNETSV